VVTRRCRRCEQQYETSDQDPDNLCLRCLHDGELEQRVAEWFLRNPLAKFEVYTTICDDRTAQVFLNDGAIGWSTKTLTRFTSRRCDAGAHRQYWREAKPIAASRGSRGRYR
jgi:hypothetical protein